MKGSKCEHYRISRVVRDGTSRESCVSIQNINSTTLPVRTCNVPAGRWKKVPEGSKGEHYRIDAIFGDGAGIEVCLAIDSNTSALQKEKQACVTFQRGAGRKCREGSKGEQYRARCLVFENLAVIEAAPRSRIDDDSAPLKAKDFVTFQRGAGRRVHKVQSGERVRLTHQCPERPPTR